MWHKGKNQYSGEIFTYFLSHYTISHNTLYNSLYAIVMPYFAFLLVFLYLDSFPAKEERNFSSSVCFNAKHV